ncbi:hypothetical protein ACFLZL_00985 [Thermodesulfobacteriota bacterium]
MSELESITELLKAYAWPLFFLVLALIFYSHILKAFTFFGELIKDRGVIGKYGDSEFKIPRSDPDDTKQKLTKEVREKVFSSSSSSPSESSSISDHSPTMANIGLDEAIHMGFGIVGTNGLEINDFFNINYNPDMRTVDLKHYETGQRVYFAIKNISNIELFAPLCFVQFPSKFKHLSMDNPEAGIMTINSELWGIGGISTELIDLNSDTSSISGFIGRQLTPGQVARFFIRFNIPDTKNEFNIVMKLKAEGYEEIEKQLVLSTNQ